MASLLLPPPPPLLGGGRAHNLMLLPWHAVSRPERRNSTSQTGSQCALICAVGAMSGMSARRIAGSMNASSGDGACPEGCLSKPPMPRHRPDPSPPPPLPRCLVGLLLRLRRSLPGDGGGSCDRSEPLGSALLLKPAARAAMAAAASSLTATSHSST